MRIDLETVRCVLRNALGHDAFIAGFIRQVVEDPGAVTACINARGVMRYAPRFVEDYVKTPQDLFAVIFHEVLHPVFSHFIHPGDKVSALACDAIINAAITHNWNVVSDDGHLFRVFYPDHGGVEALLRPNSKLNHSRYGDLYTCLYNPQYLYSGSGNITTGEFIQSLKALMPPTEKIEVVLLGTHIQGEAEWNPEDVTRVAKELLEYVREHVQEAGYSDNLTDLLIEALKSKQTIRQFLLSGYSTKKKIDSFFNAGCQQRRITSPFPLNPCRRDMLMLSAGIWPGLFRNRRAEVIRKPRGIAIYLDVSGSVYDHLSDILGVLRHQEGWIESIYLFSNAVVKITMAELCRGELKTTYGTDFDCVAEHIVKTEYEKAVIITDGYAEMEDKNVQALKAAGTQILTILYGSTIPQEDLVLKQFGEVIPLEDAVEATC